MTTQTQLLDTLTDEQKTLIQELISTMTELDDELREILPPAKIKLLKQAWLILKNGSKYGSIELVVADLAVQNINVRQSLR